MPIGLVNDEEFESELSKGVQIVEIEKGRGEGNVNVPDSLRKIIGETSEIDGRQEALALAKALGISASSVSAYANGATSTATYNKPKEEIVEHITKSKLRIAKSASSKLRKALQHLTDDKLSLATAKEISGVAKDMSSVMKDMNPSSNNENEVTKGPNFVIYAPQFRDERHFEVIQVQE